MMQKLDSLVSISILATARKIMRGSETRHVVFKFQSALMMLFKFKEQPDGT